MALLDELLRKIKRYEHVGKLSAAQRDEIGEALDQVQANLPRGEFGPWIATNLWFSYGMASYYMKCYRDNSVAKRYTEASQKAHNAEFFRKFDEMGKHAEATPGETKEMTPDDYKKLVMYMRDNLDLTNKLKVAEDREQRARQELSAARQASLAKDQQILRLRRELEEERMGGGNPFGGLFGGMASGLSKQEYRQVMSAIHPDKAATPEQRAQFDKISQIINSKMKTH